MKTVVKYLEHYKKEVVLAPLFKLLEASFELIVPLVVALMIDRGVALGQRQYIWRGLILLLCFGIVGFVCAVTAQYFAAKAAVFATASMRSDMLRKIGGLSFADLDASSDSTFLTRLTSDINQVQTTINMVLRLFLRSPFIVFGAVAMALYVDRKVSVVFLLTVALLGITVYLILRLTMPAYSRIQKQMDRLTLFVRENLTGVRVIRAFNGQERQMNRFRKENDRLASMQSAAGRISGLMNPLTTVMINAGIVGVLYTGAVRVQAGDLTQGGTVALVNYMSQILVELLKLASFIISVSKGIACAGRVEEILLLPDEENGEEAHREDREKADVSVRLCHVTFSYHPGGRPALSDICMEVKEGQTVGILGGTGSGKSTILQMIAGFYPAQRGEVEVFGEKMGVDVRRRLLRRIGIVPQKAALFAGTLADNLRWGDEKAGGERLYEALRIAQAEDFVSRKGGLDITVEEGGKNFSGGQRQRLTIARALVKNPDLLLLDDSFSALDYATDAALRRALKESRLAKTVVIATQRVSTVLHADKIYVIDDGRVVGEGTAEQLLADCPVYREIYESQNLSAKGGAHHG